MAEAPGSQSSAEERPLARSVVVIAASAGGLEPMGLVLSRMPLELAAAVVVLLHLDPHHESHLAEIFGRKAVVPVEVVRDGSRLVSGVVYVAPPGAHVVLESAGVARLSHFPEVHYVRPSADILFSSAAKAYGRNVCAVVLSGMGVDGAEGARAVRAAGGTVICQDEASAKFSGMPGAVIRQGSANYALPLSDIPAAILESIQEMA